MPTPCHIQCPKGYRRKLLFTIEAAHSETENNPCTNFEQRHFPPITLVSAMWYRTGRDSTRELSQLIYTDERDYDKPHPKTCASLCNEIENYFSIINRSAPITKIIYLRYATFYFFESTSTCLLAHVLSSDRRFMWFYLAGKHPEARLLENLPAVLTTKSQVRHQLKQGFLDVAEYLLTSERAAPAPFRVLRGPP